MSFYEGFATCSYCGRKGMFSAFSLSDIQAVAEEKGWKFGVRKNTDPDVQRDASVCSIHPTEQLTDFLLAI